MGFTINHLVEWTGFKLDRHKYSKQNFYEEILKYFEKHNYLHIGNILKENTFTIAKVKENFLNTSSGFAIIYLDELELILNFSKHLNTKEKNTPATLLLILAYLRLNIMRRSKSYYGNDNDKPEFCYRMYKNIETDIGVSYRKISKSIEQLSDLGLIAYEALPRFKTSNNEWHTHVTIFADKYRRDEYGNNINTYDYKKELEWGKEYVLLGKNQNKNNLSIEI